MNTKIQGKTIPLDRNNVDTDLIIPAQFLTSVSQQGYGENLFKNLRDADADFPFNQKKYQGASILITKENFGCGSSREHAVWALKQAGINVVIAQSFADIFFNNAVKNGLLLITQAKETIDILLNEALQHSYNVTIDLEKDIIITEKQQFNFTIDAFNKHCVINQLDDLDYLLSHLDKIKTYKAGTHHGY